MSRSLCIPTHDQLILPILGLILTSSSRAQSTIYFCTLSIRLLINSTLKNTTLTRHLLATLEFVKWSLKKFNGWLKPPLPTVKMFIVVTDVKKERKISMCANLLRPEMSLDRIVSLVLSLDRDWFTFHLRRRDQNEYSSSQKVKLLNCFVTFYH